MSSKLEKMAPKGTLFALGQPYGKKNGFTLIELMIVVVVAALLVAIAIPNYTAYVKRSHRAHAKAALLRNAQWMERVATAQGAYPAELSSQLALVEGGRYTLTLATTPPAPTTAQVTAYKITATRVSTMGNKDDKCGDFTINQAGVRELTGTPAPTLSVTECWGR